MIQKLRFRNYFVRFRSYDSETISCDSETRILKLFCAIQKNYDFKIMDHAFILAYTTSKLSPTLAETCIFTLINKHVKLPFPSGQHVHTFNIPLQTLWQVHAFACSWTSTSKFRPPLGNTFILTLYHFQIATPSGRYIRFRDHEKARQTCHSLWTTRSYLHYTTSKLPPSLANACIFTFMNKHVQIPTPSRQHVHTYIIPVVPHKAVAEVSEIGNL